MNLRSDIRYSKEERRLLERAVNDANEALTHLCQGRLRYHVAYIELSGERWDDELEAWVPTANFLAADRR